jgi:hypothetical protein
MTSAIRPKAEGVGTGDGPGRTRTSDTRFRKPVLYPLSYEAAEQTVEDSSTPFCDTGGSSWAKASELEATLGA